MIDSKPASESLEGNDQKLERSPKPIVRPPAESTPRRTSKPPRHRLGGHTSKRYDLADDAQRTVGHLRQIINQSALPPDATVLVNDRAIILEWDE